MHSSKISSSVHAEEDCVKKIKPNLNKKINVDMVILCYRKDNTLKDVLPCNRCLSIISRKLLFKGYIIKNICHSINNEIHKTSFKKVVYKVHNQHKSEKKTYTKIKNKIKKTYYQ